MKWTKQRLNNLFFFLGIAAIVVMLLTFDVSFIELWDHLCHAGYWLIPIVGVWIFVYALNALAWKATIEGNIGGKMPVSFWRLYRLTITGYALNYATPVGGLGGEPYRIMELSKDIDKQHATSSVILYAMMHFFAHFWFWFISIFIYLALAIVGDLPITTAIGITLAIIVVFCLFFFYLFSRGYKNGLVKYVLGVVANIPGCKKWTLRFWARHAESIENIDKQIVALHHQDKGAFYKSLLLEYFSRVVQCADSGIHHVVCQPHRIPAHAVGCSGGRFRALHRSPRPVGSARHLREHHLPCEGDYMDCHRYGVDEMEELK